MGTTVEAVSLRRDRSLWKGFLAGAIGGLLGAAAKAAAEAKKVDQTPNFPARIAFARKKVLVQTLMEQQSKDAVPALIEAVKDNDALFPPDWRMSYKARRAAEGHNAQGAGDDPVALKAEVEALRKQLAALAEKMDKLG